MIKKQTLVNNKNEVIEIIVEPAAEYINLKPGEEAILEIIYAADIDSICFSINNDSIVIYQEKGINLNIYINNKLVYYTEDLPWGALG